MIYIEEKSFERQISLLEHNKYLEELDLVIWFFPESKLRNTCNLKLAPKDLIEGEQVTKYGDDFKPRKTKRVELTTELLIRIRESAKEIKDNCDSLALYRKNEKNWTLCIIEHEGICLVRDESLFNTIISAGFNASLIKPE